VQGDVGVYGVSGAPSPDLVTCIAQSGVSPALTVAPRPSICPSCSASGGCPGKPGAALASDATVVSVSGSSSGANTTDVVVAMGSESVGPVVCNTANGTAGIAIVPSSGAG